MAIVDLDSGPRRPRRRGERAVIGALGGAIGVLALAFWLNGPQPVQRTPVVAPSAQPTAIVVSATTTNGVVTVYSPDGRTVISRIDVSSLPNVAAPGQPVARTLTLPPWANGVDLFELPDRLTNENLLWTLRNVVHIRGSTGLASIEGPAMITWTENGFQYWMVSPTRTTTELVEIANGLR